MEIIEKIGRKDMLREAKVFFDRCLDFTTGPIELHNMMEQGDRLNIIDVRKPEDYAKGHIVGAINLPEEQWITFRGLSKDRPNIVYCYSLVCQLSTKAARYFAEHDFPVMQLLGGFDEWKKHELPIVT